VAGQKISGHVFSNDPKVPLGSVQIRVSTFPQPTFIETDLFGYFEMELPTGTWILHASAEGFTDLNEKITLSPGQNVHPSLRLEPLEYEAETFVVHGQANRPNPVVMQMLNAPLQPAPTEFEKKIAPAVRVFKFGFIATIWTLIALSAIAAHK
jgi:hypothetical protein